MPNSFFNKIRKRYKDIFHPKNDWDAGDWYQIPDFDLDKDIMMEIIRNRGIEFEDIKVGSTYGGNYVMILIKTQNNILTQYATVGVTKEEYDNYNSEYVKRKKRGEIINKILK